MIFSIKKNPAAAVLIAGSMCTIGVGVAAWAAGNSIYFAPSIAFAFTLLGVFAVLRKDKPVKPVLGIALMGQCIALTSSLAGHSWQIDSHMVFFAALAILMALRDIKTIVAATLAVALHHLTLSMLLPSLVYPDGNGLTNLGRTLFHATIVLLEAAILIYAIHRQNALIARQERLVDENLKHLADAREASKRLEETRAAEQKRYAEQSEAIDALTAGLARLAKGELSQELNGQLAADYEPLRDQFNLAITNMRELVSALLSQAEDMSGKVSDIQSGTQDLSARTEEQASTLMQTASALEDLVGSAEKTTKHASSANMHVEQTCRSAQDSSDVLGQTVDCMQRIKGSSDEISHILTVIDDIAFQTNLLALNAGVEAARAGSAGKGFAVVAAEVRALAQRTSEAAEEIGRLITASRSQVNEGVDLVTQTETKLTAMTDQFTALAELMSQINRSSQSQSGRLREINVSVGELDLVTQQNAAMAEETFAATMDLMQENQRLNVAAKRFSVTKTSIDSTVRSSAA